MRLFCMFYIHIYIYSVDFHRILCFVLFLIFFWKALRAATTKITEKKMVIMTTKSSLATIEREREGFNEHVVCANMQHLN